MRCPDKPTLQSWKIDDFLTFPVNYFFKRVLHFIPLPLSSRRAVAAAASWVFDTGFQDHRADVLECPPAELAGEIAGNVAAESRHYRCLHLTCSLTGPLISNSRAKQKTRRRLPPPPYILLNFLPAGQIMTTALPHTPARQPAHDHHQSPCKSSPCPCVYRNPRSEHPHRDNGS